MMGRGWVEAVVQAGAVRAAFVPEGSGGRRDIEEVAGAELVEDPEPEGPFGAKGVGEIGLVPTAPAVAAALEAFDGIRRYELPMRDSPAARAMSVGRRAKNARS